jgi:hypothetical protein
MRRTTRKHSAKERRPDLDWWMSVGILSLFVVFIVSGLGQTWGAFPEPTRPPDDGPSKPRPLMERVREWDHHSAHVDFDASRRNPNAPPLRFMPLMMPAENPASALESFRAVFDALAADGKEMGAVFVIENMSLEHTMQEGKRIPVVIVTLAAYPVSQRGS